MWALIAFIILIIFISVFSFITLRAHFRETSDSPRSYSGASKDLTNLLKDVNTETIGRVPVSSTYTPPETDLLELLPDISRFPAQVFPPSGKLTAEIVTSTEKAIPSSPGTPGRWLIDMAEAFNAQERVIGGNMVAISIRAIPSGVAADYIVKGKYVPDAFTPASRLWVDALAARGVTLDLITESLVGNVAGMAIKKENFSQILKQYEAVNVDTVVRAVTAGELLFGYTSPNVSTTGANFLLTVLYGPLFDAPLHAPKRMLEFEKFQTKIPFIAYDTPLMVQSARRGMLDGFVLEHQQYKSSAELQEGYEFVPFGLPHDNPLYSTHNISKQKKEILLSFTEFCLEPENQLLAQNQGFNLFQDYSFQGNPKIGEELPEALELFRKNKRGGKKLIVAFVVDNSPSMAPYANPILSYMRHAANLIGQDSRVGLLSFDSKVSIHLPASGFDLPHRERFLQSVSSLNFHNGESDQNASALVNAILVAEKMLLDERERNPEAELIIIALSDGIVNFGHSYAKAHKTIQQLDVAIHALIFAGESQDFQDLALDSGGTYLLTHDTFLDHGVKNFLVTIL